MPVYEFACESCGLQFEKLRKMSESDAPAACPECGVDARKLVSASNFSFAHVPVGGPRPQNTGVHGIDYSADRTIGQDAEQRWRTIEARSKQKDEAIRGERAAGRLVTREHLTRTGEGDYRVLTEPERERVNQGRDIYRQVLKTSAPTKLPGSSA